MITVSNTSPITSLAAIGQLDLLRQQYGTVYIPPHVQYELTIKGGMSPGGIEVQTADWIVCASISDSILLKELTESRKIHRGEAEALVLAVEKHADRILLDDKQARLAAEALGLEKIGVLGILIAAKQEGTLTQVGPLLDYLLDVGFRIDPRLYKGVLRQVGEE